MLSHDEGATTASSEGQSEVLVTEPLGAGIDFADPNSPLAKYYLRPADAIGVFLICLITTFVSNYPLWHTDIWGHVAFGEWMVRHGSLPDHEPFSPFSDQSVKPLHAQWLTQLIYGGIVRFSEFIGSNDSSSVQTLSRTVEFLRLFHVLLAGIMLSFLWLACRRIGGSPGWANFAILVAFFYFLYPLSVQRPQSVGLTLFAVLLYLLSDGDFSRRTRMATVLLFVLWANLHGTVVVGLAAFLLVAAARILQGWYIHLTHSSSNAQGSGRNMLITWGASVLAASTLNAEGPLLIPRIARFASDHPSVMLFSEWQGMTLSPSVVPALRYISLSVLLILVWSASRFSRTFLVLSLTPFAIWPLFQVRGSLWWYLMAPWLIAACGPAITGRLRLVMRLPRPAPNFRLTLLASSFIIFAVIWIWSTRELRSRLRPQEPAVSLGTPWRLGFELQAPPENAGKWLPGFAEAVQRGYPEQRYRGTIFAAEGFSDYLIRFAAADQAPVMIYSHFHFFPLAFCESCLLAKSAVGDWRGWFASHHVNLVVIPPDLADDLAAALRQDSDWQIILDQSDAPGPRMDGNRCLIAIRKKPV